MLTMSWVTEGIVAETKELLGDRAGAEKALVSVWRAFRDVRAGAPDARAMQAAYRLANLYCDDGRWSDAEACIAFHGDVSIPHQAVQAAYRLAAAGRLAAHDGDLVEAAALAGRALGIAQSTDEPNTRARIWLAAADVRRASGNRAEADAAVAAALELYEQKGNTAATERLRSAAVGV